MLREIYDICITMLLDALEMFCSVLVVPTPKILRTALYISLGILVFSLAGEYAQLFIFADWYECVICSVMILILWGISLVNDNHINTFKNKLSGVTTNMKKKGEKKNGSNKR